MKKIKYYLNFRTNSYIRYIPYFRSNKLLWKEKYGTPRVELSPKIHLEWLWFEFTLQKGSDCWWERWLWLHKFCNSDIEKAKNSWPWVGLNEIRNSWDNY